jgi:hypothetical protein
MSVQIPRESAEYMCRELHAPIILVQADVEQKRTFWSAAQLDTQAMRSLARLPKQGSVTFRIPTKNHLPDTWGGLLQAVSQTETLLSLRSLLNEPFPSFLDSIEGR